MEHPGDGVLALEEGKKCSAPSKPDQVALKNLALSNPFNICENQETRRFLTGSKTVPAFGLVTKR